MIRLEMKNCNMILTEKQQKYQHYHLENLIVPSSQRQIIDQATFSYSPLGKSFEKQTKKQVGAIKSVHVIKKKYK